MNTRQNTFLYYLCIILNVVLISASVWCAQISFSKLAPSSEFIAIARNIDSRMAGLGNYLIQLILEHNRKSPHSIITIQNLYNNLFKRNAYKIQNDLHRFDISTFFFPDRIELMGPEFTLVFIDAEKFPERGIYKIPQTNIQIDLYKNVHYLDARPRKYIMGIDNEKLDIALGKERLIQSHSGIRINHSERREELTDEEKIIAILYAYNYLKFIHKNTGQKKLTFVIGRDPRPTGKQLLETQARGFLIAAGELGIELEIINLGVLPKPMYQNAVRVQKAQGGVYITASHNEVSFNGLEYSTKYKLEGGFTFGGALLNSREIRMLIGSFTESIKRLKKGDLGILDEINKFIPPCIAVNKDKLNEAKESYKKFVLEKFGLPSNLSGIRIVLDPNGGAGCSIYKEILEEIGIQVVEINNNIGQPAHMIDPEKEKRCYDRMVEIIKKEGALFGMTFDYDGDRAYFVALGENGSRKTIHPQDTAAVNVAITLTWCKLNKKLIPKTAVIASDSTSGRIREIANMFDAEVFYVETGETNLVNKMHELRKKGWFVPVAVEGANGGTVFFDSMCRDGLLNTICIAYALSNPDLDVPISKKYYTELIEIKDMDIPIEELKFGLVRFVEEKFPSIKRLLGVEKLYYEIHYYEGLSHTINKTMIPERGIVRETGGWKLVFKTKDNERHFIWIRPSNTEPNIIRVEFDSTSKEVFQKLKKIFNIVRGREVLDVEYLVSDILQEERQGRPYGILEFENMILSFENLREYIRSGRILEIIPEWKDWEAMWENESFRRYHHLSPREHLILAFRRLEDVYFQDMIAREKFTEDDLMRLMRALFLHDFGKITVLKKDPTYTSQAEHPKESEILARKIFLRLGYKPEEVDVDLMLIRNHSILADLAGKGKTETDLLKFVDSLKNIKNLRLLRILQLVDAASVRPEFENSLSQGLEERIRKVTGLVQGILVAKTGLRKIIEEKLKNYLSDIKRQNAEIVRSFNKLRHSIYKNNVMIKGWLLQNAFLAMHRSHLGQLRKDGKIPFAIHCIDTARILVDEFGVRDPDWIIAVLLHDVLEDTRTSVVAIERLFGKKVASIVTLLSKPSKELYPSKEERDKDYLHRLIYGTDEINDREILTAAQTIKFADRIHNLRSLLPDIAKKTIDGTYEIFMPYFIGETEVSLGIKKKLIQELVKAGTKYELLTPGQIEMLKELSGKIVEFKMTEQRIKWSPYDFIRGLAEYRKKEAPNMPVVLAFDGMSGSGKTSIVKMVQETLERADKKVIVFDSRDYLLPRSVRDAALTSAIKEGLAYIEQRERLYDFRRFKKEVLDKIREFKVSNEKQIEFKLSNLYNPDTGILDKELPPYKIDKDTVVLIEGMNILQGEFLPIYDATFLIYTPKETCLENVLQRERRKQWMYRQSRHRIMERFRMLDWPSYSKHWFEYWLSSGFIIDNADYRKVTIKRNYCLMHPEKGPRIPEEYINPEIRLTKTLERIFERLSEKDINPYRIVYLAKSPIGVLRNLLTISNIRELLPKDIDVPLADSDVTVLGIFLDQLKIKFGEKLIDLFANLLNIYSEEKCFVDWRLFSYWEDKDEIPILLDVEYIKDHLQELARFITRIGISIKPDQRIKIILTHPQMKKDEVRKIFRPLYKTINLGRRETKKEKILVGFELNNLGLGQDAFRRYITSRLEMVRRIDARKILIFAAKGSVYRDIEINSLSNIYLDKLREYINSIKAEIYSKEGSERNKIEEELKKFMGSSECDEFTQLLIWNVLCSMGLDTEPKGKVIYSISALRSMLRGGIGIGLLKDLLAWTKGKVFFYAGKEYRLSPKHKFLRKRLVTTRDLEKNKEFIVYMLNREDMQSLGIDIKMAGKLNDNMFTVPIEGERDIKNDISLGLEIIRNRGDISELSPLFNVLLIETIKLYLKKSGKPVTCESVKEILGIEPKEFDPAYIEEMKKSYEKVKEIIQSA